MKYLIFIIPFFVTCSTYSINRDSLEIIDLQQKIIGIEKNISSVRSIDCQQQKQIQNLIQDSDSLKNILVITQQQAKAIEEQFNSDIDEARLVIKNNNDLLSKEIQTKTVYGSIGLGIALLIAGIIYFILHKRISTESLALHKIKQAQNSIQEESVKLDNKLIELLNKQLNVEIIQNTSLGQEHDHLLALKVADEIVRIEMNLSRMDISVKGHKQLCKAVERIKNNFLANGYEMVNMLGKPYNEGMKVVANFVSDENLKEGEQVITGIIKPQINYNGVMIQAVQITVSQNI